jgi:hypothetical protein
LTAKTKESDSYFDGGEFGESNELTEKDRDRPLFLASRHQIPVGTNRLFFTCSEAALSLLWPAGRSFVRRFDRARRLTPGLQLWSFGV